jgi:hypothetical protein
MAEQPAIVCDMSTARDTEEERLAEYRRLFDEALAGRERVGAGIRFRFQAAAGVEAWVRDLAEREKACCAFFDFTVTAENDEVWWDCTVPDDDLARAILDEFHALPDTFAEHPDLTPDAIMTRVTRV